jgi:hypothetical protein
MSEGTILFLVGQALAILIGVLGAHVRSSNQIAELRGMVMQLQISVTGLKTDHSNLAEKVDNINQHVSHIEGMEEARIRNGRCRYAAKGD